MNLPAIIDVALGLIVLYLLLSTFCSFGVELIATWRWWRKRLLYETIGRLITGLSICKAPSAPILPRLGRQSRPNEPLQPPTPPTISNAVLFSAADIRNAKQLVEQLEKMQDRVSEFVVTQDAVKDLLAKLKKSTKAPKEVDLRSQLAAALNAIICEGAIYEAHRFASVALSAETRSRLRPDLQGNERAFLNRLLLQDAYPDCIRQIPLCDRVLAAFWEHPLARNLAPGRQIPSYIEPATFATIVVDIAVPGASTGTLPTTTEGIERVIELAASSGELSFRPLCTEILRIYRLRRLNPERIEPAPLAALRGCIEKWYLEAMDRLTGQYKRKAQRWLLGLGVGVAIAFNADTVRTVAVLASDDALRGALSTYAATLAVSTNTPAVFTNAPTAATVQAASNVFNMTVTNEIELTVLRTNLVHSLKDLQRLQQMGFPLGWKAEGAANFAPYGGMVERAKGNGLYWLLLALLKLAGLIATALAVSLGAPFWFDLLNKLVNLRGAGKRLASSEPAPATTSSDEKATRAATSGASPAASATAPDVTALIPAEQFLKDLLDARLGFNVRKAYWTAEAAVLAYAAEQSVRSACEQWSPGSTWIFEETEAAQGFLTVDKQKKVAVLAFRGTEQKLEDWKTDAAFELTASAHYAGQTHAGFAKELDKVYSKIVDELKQCTAPDTLLFVAGHSLGAALATLMAARLTKENLEKQNKQDRVCGVHAVYTFGSPRVGDIDFAKAYTLALGHCTYRIVNGEDLVTRVPPRYVPVKEWRYEHVGHIVYFDSDGRMHMNVGFWERFLNTVINAVHDFRNTPKAALKDHSMEGYVRLLKRQITI